MCFALACPCFAYACDATHNLTPSRAFLLSHPFRVLPSDKDATYCFQNHKQLLTVGSKNHAIACGWCLLSLSAQGLPVLCRACCCCLPQLFRKKVCWLRDMSHLHCSFAGLAHPGPPSQQWGLS